MGKNMYFVAAFLAVSSVALGNDQRSVPGNPPQILLAASIDEHRQLELVSYRTIYIGFDGSSYNHRSTKRISLEEVVIQDLDGNPLTLAKARQRLADGETAVLFLSWREPLSPFYRKLFAKDVLVFVFPREAPTWQTIQDPTRPLSH